MVSQDAVTSAGPLLALVGFLVLPFVWSVPEALVTAELATAFPEDSGCAPHLCTSHTFHFLLEFLCMQGQGLLVTWRYERKNIFLKMWIFSCTPPIPLLSTHPMCMPLSGVYASDCPNL